jgi:ribA/ribD-fused uncharacterized protein
MKYQLDWLKKLYDQGENIKYIFFWGHSNKANEPVGKFVFSQWYPSSFIVGGIEYKTSEHWMMAQKAKLFNDQSSFDNIISATKPGEVKEIGRQIKSFKEDVWNSHKHAIVVQGNIHKFSQNPQLKDYLLSTADRVLVEASPTDVDWGIGLTQDAKMVENPHTWRGENLLGFALMEVRDQLRK